MILKSGERPALKTDLLSGLAKEDEEDLTETEDFET